MTLKELLGDQYKDGMTVEEMEAAIAGIDVISRSAHNAELGRIKGTLDKKLSELAATTKELRSKQTEEEAAKAKHDLDLSNLQEENTQLKRTISITDQTARFVELGYSLKLAKKAAEAQVDGDFATVFECMKQRETDLAKTYEQRAIEKTPLPPAGTEPTAKESFEKMTVTQQMKFKAENPEAYAALMGSAKH